MRNNVKNLVSLKCWKFFPILIPHYWWCFCSPIDIDKSEKFYYFNLYNWKIEIITKILSQIKDNDILLISPFISTTRKPQDAYLRLSENFLITKESSPSLISNLFCTQWDNSGFEVVEGETAWLYIKYKKVYLNKSHFTPV